MWPGRERLGEVRKFLGLGWVGRDVVWYGEFAVGSGRVWFGLARLAGQGEEISVVGCGTVK